MGFVDCCGAALPSFPTTGGADAFVRKYDLNGNELFTRQLGTDGDDYAYGVAVGTSNVLVVGGTGGAFPGQTYTSNGDAFMRLYDFNGNELGTREFGNSSPPTGFLDPTRDMERLRTSPGSTLLEIRAGVRWARSRWEVRTLS